MAKFTAGPHTFDVRLTVGLVGEIRRQTGVDLGSVLESGEGFAAVLFAAPETLAQVLWVAAEAQAAAAGLTPEGFAYLFDGDAVDAAVTALMEAATDFFPKARGRDAMRRRLPRVMAEIEATLAARIEAGLTSSSTAGSSPASPGSTPGPSPSGN